MKRGVATLALVTSASASATPELAWNETFADVDRPVHFQARYTELGEGHRVDVWRVPHRVRRETDARLVVVAADDGEDVRIEVLDRARFRLLRATRATLLRGGMLVDAFEMRTGLHRPGGPYSLEPLQSAAVEGRAACSWFSIKSPMSRLDVCWSMAWGLPMRIEADERVVFVVDAVEEREAGEAAFRLSAPNVVDGAPDED